MMNLEEIKQILPHRYPFLLVDRVLEVEPGKRARALKNVTGNEAFFQGHFPGYPLMPGVLIIEAMAQTCGFIAHSATENPKGILLLFAGIENCRFKSPVVPGDQVIFDTELVTTKRTLWIFNGKATVDGKLAAQAEIRMVTMER
ncbi:MAG: 3-hydroxyacyl-ACP dehydratase FabZ [Deltaproteobacteria bacterium]|nr:3-hydroxyacyl-ACP dehydratase FabZ [Deltaproteobacteria bacterium]